MRLIESIQSGDRLALSRLLTQVENDSAQGRAALAALFPVTGRAHLIGITGAPVTPTRCARPVWGKREVSAARPSGESFSTRLSSRASASRSPVKTDSARVMGLVT